MFIWEWCVASQGGVCLLWAGLGELECGLGLGCGTSGVP